ncbi:MAG: hypothetical protein ACPHE0_07480 [Pseudomonadales bacterium]
MMLVKHKAGTRMEYAIAFASEIDSWKWAKRAEELGFDAAWFYDTQLLNPDVFVCMALAAHDLKDPLGHWRPGSQQPD